MSAREEAVQETYDKNVFGFWVYLMTDCVLFATLFAVFAILRNETYGGPSGQELFSLKFVLVETLILLTSSFTCGLATIAAHRRDKKQVLAWFGATFLLGAAFLAMEINEFARLASEGHSWRASAFLSSFFVLVGTHGLHITIGLIWVAVLMFRLWKRGFTSALTRKLAMLSLFWHFLDIIWIFIFTIVYLVGAIAI